MSIRPRTSRLLVVSVALLAAFGTAVASADETPSSSPDVYRQTTGSANLATSGAAGSGVTVAVIDTGVADVPAFDGHVVYQQNISAAPQAGDQFGHGTFVAGLVHNVAPGADIVSIKLSGADGSVDITQVLAALQWVSINKDRFGIDVVNLSFGNDSKQSASTSPLNFAVQQLWDEGIVVVASAGNVGDQPGTVTKPADDPLIISVGASDEHGTSDRSDDSIPTFVSRGPTQDGLAKPDLVAPGTHVVSVRAPGSTIDTLHPEARVGDDQFRGSGTSFAAPIVAGVVSQMLSAEPNLTPDQVKYGLLKGATWINGDPAALGAGTVRASRALQFASSGRANANAQRSTGRGSIDLDRGSMSVEVDTKVELLDGSFTIAKARVRGNHTAEVVPTFSLAPLLGGDTTVLDALDDFDTAEFTQASSWGASQWGASQWGASQWGASQWGASQWGASQWGSTQWWASQWG
jgi:serine protease AprX